MKAYGEGSTAIMGIMERENHDKIPLQVLKPDFAASSGWRKNTKAHSRKASTSGISTIYRDHSSWLITTMDMTWNLFLGNERPEAVSHRRGTPMNERGGRLLEDLDIHIPDVTVPVGNLSGGQRRGVAVARLVHRAGRSDRRAYGGNGTNESSLQC